MRFVYRRRLDAERQGRGGTGQDRTHAEQVTGQQIVVEGFTDNVPIGPALKARFPSNWELSSARATDVLRFLVSKGVPANSISAQGFGDSRPVASNNTAEGRAKNRRVEIVIMAASRP